MNHNSDLALQRLLDPIIGAEVYNPYDLDDDTPMQIRLRNQIRQNQSLGQFREVKIEL